jgi:hypothetical protein
MSQRVSDAELTKAVGPFGLDQDVDIRYAFDLRDARFEINVLRAEVAGYKNRLEKAKARVRIGANSCKGLIAFTSADDLDKARRAQERLEIYQDIWRVLTE